MLLSSIICNYVFRYLCNIRFCVQLKTYKRIRTAKLKTRVTCYYYIILKINVQRIYIYLCKIIYLYTWYVKSNKLCVNELPRKQIFCWALAIISNTIRPHWLNSNDYTTIVSIVFIRLVVEYITICNNSVIESLSLNVKPKSK